MILTAVATTNEILWHMVIFAMFFSLGLSLFYTLFADHFLEQLASRKIKPRWLFFVLLPAIVGGFGSYKTEWSFFALVGLFGLLAVAVILASVMVGIAGAFGALLQYRRDKKAGKYKDIEQKPAWQKILGLLAAIGMIVAFFSGIHFFFVALIAILFFSSLLPTPKSTFLNLQASLPTSKIRSLAMGLVEIKGRAVMNLALKAPIDDKPCIGYRYTVEDISKDDDGDEHFSIVEDMTCCNVFHVDDGTGQASIKPDGISFVSVSLDGGYRANQKRYQQYLLFDGDEILLIGSAGLEDNKLIIEKEKFRNILALSPVSYVDTWNTFRPLVRAYTVWMTILALSVAVVLMMPIRIENGKVMIRTEQNFSDWGQNTIINKDQEALEAKESEKPQPGESDEISVPDETADFSEKPKASEDVSDAYKDAKGVIHNDHD
jgi:hypothetical protein